MSNAPRDTGRARLPGLPPVNAQDPTLRNWMSAVAERLEVREGSRGNPYERAVTLRELSAATAGLVEITDSGRPDPNALNTIPLGNGLSASINVERFVTSIKNSRVYRDLLKRLDDPSRFDAFASEIRGVLLKSIADEAAKRGADIQRTEVKIQDVNRSLAMVVEELTAALGSNSAGLRELQATYANQSSATATKVTQLEVSLGNYYQDGSPGRVRLEQELTTQASFVNGLRGQYTLKIQAGGALAGFGLAAQEVNGVPSSAFIISADKFAIVSPNYSGGLTNNPDVGTIPFGVDANGIYLNNNVYVRGQMRVDTGGKTLLNGLRGSLTLSATGGVWSDTTARQAVWSALGNTGSAPNNNHLVIGDQVTITSGTFAETRYWNDSAWVVPGAVINGNLLINGSVAAQKIDTRGLTVRDANGNVILDAGAGLTLQQRFVGLGGLATQNSVTIGTNVRFPDGSTMGTMDFVNNLSKISAGNISTFMESAAIGSAYIGNAAIGSAQIADAAITSAKIGDAAITNAKIGTAEIDTLKIAGGAVTLTSSTESSIPATSASIAVTVPAGTQSLVVIAGIGASATPEKGGSTYWPSPGTLTISNIAGSWGGASAIVASIQNPSAGSYTASVTRTRIGQEFTSPITLVAMVLKR